MEIQSAPLKTTPPPPLRMVSVGDSLTAGTQDAVTISDRQERVYARQLADQVGVPFNNALIGGDGVPFPVFAGHKFNQRHVYANTLRIAAGLVPLGLFTYYIGVPPLVFPAWRFLMGERTRESRDAPERPQSNFAVPGFEIRHLNDVAGVKDVLRAINRGTEEMGALGGEVPLTDAILNNGNGRVKGSPIDQVVASDPDLVLFWAGGNDALQAALTGYVDDRTLTPFEDKRWQFSDKDPITSRTRQRTTKDPMPGFNTSLQDAIRPILDRTRAEVVLMNVPDVTVIPNLMKVGQRVGPLPFRVELMDGTDVTDRLESWVIPSRINGTGKGGRREFPEGSTVPMATLLKRFVEKGANNVTGDKFDRFLKKLGEQALFYENEVMDPDELGEVSGRIGQFNDAIASLAAQNPRLHLVDANGVLKEMKDQGRALRGQGDDVTVTTTFTGVRDGRNHDGIFSFDGVHPSDTGHAVIANVILDKIKADLGADPRFVRFKEAAHIDEKAVYRTDPHLPGGRDFAVVLGPEPTPEVPEGSPYDEALRRAGVPIPGQAPSA